MPVLQMCLAVRAGLTENLTEDHNNWDNWDYKQ